MPLMRWDPWYGDPFAALAGLDRVFDELFWSGGDRPTGRYLPGVDVTTEGTDALIGMELPGVRPDEVNVEVVNGCLTISGERKDRRDQEQGRLLARDMRYGTFRRSFRLPDGVEPDQISAHLEDGVLQVRIRNVAQPVVPPRRIPVRGAASRQIEGEVLTRHELGPGPRHSR